MQSKKYVNLEILHQIVDLVEGMYYVFYSGCDKSSNKVKPKQGEQDGSTRNTT